MKTLILPSICILALSASTVYAGGGFSRLAIEDSYNMVRNRISLKPDSFMKYSSRKYGTSKFTIGSKPTRPMPENPSYEEMPKQIRFLDEQHERYVPKTSVIKETSKDSLPNVEKKNSSTTIFTPQKKK